MQISLQQKNMKPKLILVAILAAYAMPQMVMAENKAETIELGKVEVVGVTPLSSLGVPIDQVPSNVQVAKGKDIQNQQGLSIADYMNQNMVGVNINEAQNNPYQPDVNFRGFTASPLVGTPQGLSVYQDGVRVNEPFGDTVNWDLIPQNAISSIALMPGSNPLFGLNTLGGAVSVQTKSGEHNPGGGVQVSGGSWGRWAVEGEYGGKLDNGVSYFFAGNKFEESGWRDSSPSDVLQGFGKLGWSNEKTDVDISFTGADNELTGNGYQAQSLLNTFGRESIYTKPDITKNKLLFVNAKVSTWLSDEFLLTTNAYYRKNRTSSYNGDLSDDWAALGDDEGVINRGHVNQKGYGLGSQLTWVTDKNQLTGGVSADLSRINFEQTSQLFSTFDAARGVGGTLDDVEQDVLLKGRSRTWSVFATDTYNATSKLALTASARYNNTRINNSDDINPVAGTYNPVTGAGSLTGSDTYSRFNPAVGLTYSMMPELNMYAGYNEGNRAPSVIELGCSDPNSPCLLPNALAGDPPLKQVVAKTFEGGVRGKFSDIAKWSLSAYRATNYDDLIFIASTSTTGAGYFNNVGKTRRQGIDLGLSGEAGDFRWSAGYSYIKATYESSFDIASDVNSSNVGGVITVNPGDNIPGIPKHQLKLRGEWSALPTWTIGASAVFFSDQYARGNENNQHQADGVNFFGSGKIGGYGVLNLDTRYTLPNTGWQVFAKVNNVFDRDYYTSALLGQSGFDANGAFANGSGANETFLAPGAPRAGWVGVRYEFGKPKSSASTAVDVD
ncbi:TonB-dependent receptor [Methylotenera sp.]|uniref:TonB-dependent receptor n=1 Tax=Methylotenera sp. TaxID=2051956 RepID=UPI00248A1297|nr:TonB-dependent receptor [Methylotenera sp.]MDI1298169.1 TonB-dependent receptor [Methylotenera sp.]